VLQVTPQLWPSQAALPLAGVPHAVHALGPHELVLSSERHRPLQLWVPDGHWFAHACPAGMQAPEHSFWPVRQVPPHAMPSQVAVPPVGAVHATHDTPQVSGARFDTQALPHRW
jgi:hypothetical protein